MWRAALRGVVVWLWKGCGGNWEGGMDGRWGGGGTEEALGVMRGVGGVVGDIGLEREY